MPAPDPQEPQGARPNPGTKPKNPVAKERAAAAESGSSGERGVEKERIAPADPVASDRQQASARSAPPPLPGTAGPGRPKTGAGAVRPTPARTAAGAPPPIPVPPKRTNFRARIETSRRNNVKKAGLFVLLVAFLQLTLGLYTGYQKNQECEQVRARLATMDPDTELELETQRPTFSRRRLFRDAASEKVTVTVTAGELRRTLAVVGKIAVLLPVLLGLAFLACFVWARSQPWHALLAALGLFCLAVAVSLVFESNSLLHGLLLKVVTLVMLLGGIRDAAALKRNAEAARRLAPATVRRPGVRRRQSTG